LVFAGAFSVGLSVVFSDTTTGVCSAGFTAGSWAESVAQVNATGSK
jgi:hypothetical protein